MEVVTSLCQGRTAAAQCGLLYTNQSRSYLNHLVQLRRCTITTTTITNNNNSTLSIIFNLIKIHSRIQCMRLASSNTTK